ncbi:aminoglycoside 3'-phosphotransferase/choline kinase family protein [bacterium]|nr:aminoglycoside 3'-phosphotransferase/choline kinase family protein [bacterium]
MPTSPPLLPLVRDEPQFEALKSAGTDFRPAMRAICDRHGIEAKELVPLTPSSLIVFRAGDRAVVKLFPPCCEKEFTVESKALELLSGRAEVPTPRLIATGELEGWPYVVMERIAGRLLSDAWPEIAAADRERLAEDLGRCIRAMHDSPADDLPRPGGGSWEEMQARFQDAALARHRASSAPREWIDALPEFLAGRTLPLEENCRALLHTELADMHILVERAAEHWELRGVIDFEPAMPGDPMYDFAGLGFLLFNGEHALIRRFLRAYGIADSQLGAEFQETALRYVLTHRYTNLEWFLSAIPPTGAAGDFKSWAQDWYGLA